VPGEQVDQALRCVVAEAEREVAGGLGGGRGAAGEQRLFVRGECRLDVVGVRGEGRAEPGAVVHGQVGALAVGR
jgi:hypothetical protein